MCDWNKNRMSFESSISEMLIQYAPPLADIPLLYKILDKFEIMKLWGTVGVVNKAAFNTVVKIKDIPDVGPVLVELRRK